MASISKRTIFFTGATGYVGGTVLTRLVDHPTFANSEITLLVRPSKKDKISALHSLGLNTVLGSYNDLDILEEQASKADIVFSVADADNLAAAQAILRGLKRRYEATGQQPLLIHTSGTGVLVDDAKGLYPTDVIYDDLNPDRINALAITQLHRNVDVAIVDADNENYVKAYIILPPTIYALAKTRFVDLGLQNPRSLQIPQLIRAGLLKGQGGMVGKGENVWPNVHIDDIADLYIIVYENALSGKAGHGREGFYFGENGEHKLYDLSKVVAQELYNVGRGKSPEPAPFTEEDYKRPENFGLEFLGTNARCLARRARALGWKPKYTTEDAFKSIKPEVEYVIQSGNY
ncbi:hypothetical protein BKA82DRAFT_1003327 [Pisolithus tinctorius]|uniref:NmrA-like domain-containing protein n=1 Tax=Pisolithus tinctorius Marx 270 TaxID=870435 RepID=A0A0C3NJ69_PISTI|nr:hypothetical protein BKA82DRAFT_1003327 [Pisolithus tinctorius]KIO01035.1 hypothetical protein M404DRAFT_1003327 [Pisolithus tinctorius Marx 270]